MSETERDFLSAELLTELAPLFRERLAADHWGRLLVGVQRREENNETTGFRVTSLDVENIFGDEARIEEAFGPDGPRAVLAQATEALSSLAGVALEETNGGTFLQSEAGVWAWLPGLVRTPSEGLERVRDEAVVRLRQQHARLPFDLQRVRRADVNLENRHVNFFGAGDAMIGSATTLLLGSFSSRSHRWSWAWAHESLPSDVRRLCKDTIDQLLDRDLWELSTTHFATDEATIWALCAFVCDRTKAAGVFRVAQPDGAIYLLLLGTESVVPIAELS